MTSPSPKPGVLAADERLEQPRHIPREMPGPVSETSTSTRSRGCRTSTDSSPAGRHRVERVEDQVHQHLLELPGVGDQASPARRCVHADCDPLLLGPAADQAEDAVDHGEQVDRLPLRLRRAGEVEERLERPLHPPDLALDHPQVLGRQAAGARRPPGPPGRAS